MLIVPAVVFLLVAGVGAAASYSWNPAATGPADRSSFSLSDTGPDGDTLVRLADYTRSIGTGTPPAKAGDLLPDVNTMIERLVARLETKPDDLQGWQMLGWSYFNVGHYEQAATAYAKAVELNPSSEELKRALEEAKAKASGSGSLKMAASEQTEGAAKSGGPDAETITKFKAMDPNDRNAAIRSMVDGLAARLESSPRDVEGWTRLMRSRVVLGEKAVAETALRKALEVFKDDVAASSTIMAAANELGLKAE